MSKPPGASVPLDPPKTCLFPGLRASRRWPLATHSVIAKRLVSRVLTFTRIPRECADNRFVFQEPQSFGGAGRCSRGRGRLILLMMDGVFNMVRDLINTSTSVRTLLGACAIGATVTLAACGGSDPGATAKAAAPQGGASVGEKAGERFPVFRFAKISNGAYFYTGSRGERDLIASDFPDFRYEGPQFAGEAEGGGAVPVYRFANLNNGGYFFTANEAEKDAVRADPNFAHFRFEGSTFAVTGPGVAGAAPVYRLANLTGNGAYLYTFSAEERDIALALRTAGGQPVWRDEGIAYHSLPSPATTAKIMPLGADFTRGNETDPAPGASKSYRGSLYQLLSSNGYKFDAIGSQSLAPSVGGDPDHEAINGASIGPDANPVNIYDRIPTILGQAVNPDIIIMALGYGTVIAEGAAAAAKYEGLVNRIKQARPGAKLLLATLHRYCGGTESFSETSVPGYGAFNAKVKELANASATDNVYFVDLETTFDSGDYHDCVNLNSVGAPKAGQAIYDALVSNNMLAGSKQ